MKRIINLNDEVTVTLTEAGAKIYNATPRALMTHVQVGDQVTEQLWEIFRIFGGCHLGPGKPIHFHGNVMDIDMWEPAQNPSREVSIDEVIKTLEAWETGKVTSTYTTAVEVVCAMRDEMKRKG